MTRRYLAVGKARKIAYELDNDINLEKNVKFLYHEVNLTAKTLRESDIETSLARHAWVEDLALRDDIQYLLMTYVGVERKYLEGQRKRNATARAKKTEKSAHIQAQKAAFLEDELRHIETALPKQAKPSRVIAETAEMQTPVLKKKIKKEVPEAVSEGGYVQKSDESLDNSIVGLGVTDTPREAVELCNRVQLSPAAILARKLKELPSRPSEVEAARLLPEVTGPLLIEAEEVLSCQMKRVDSIWWKLLERDLGIHRADVSFSDVRSLYTEEMTKRRSLEAASSPALAPMDTSVIQETSSSSESSSSESSDDSSGSSSQSYGSSDSSSAPREVAGVYAQEYATF